MMTYDLSIVQSFQRPTLFTGATQFPFQAYEHGVGICERTPLNALTTNYGANAAG